MGKNLLLVPFGGIGNRISAIESAYRLSSEIGANLRVVWFRDWGMKASFQDLFEDIEGVAVSEPTFADKILNDRPRKRNLFFPAPFQGMVYDRCFYDDRRHISKDEFHAPGKIYIASCYDFYEGKTEYGIFRPNENLNKRIGELTSRFSANTIGIQIRRTDHLQSAEKSPTSLFIRVMKNAPSDSMFYVASDSRQVKEELTEVFPGRVIYDPLTLKRGSLEAECEAAAELFALSHCSSIIGSWGSTYGIRAAEIGHVPFKFITDCL